MGENSLIKYDPETVSFPELSDNVDRNSNALQRMSKLQFYSYTEK